MASRLYSNNDLEVALIEITRGTQQVVFIYYILYDYGYIHYYVFYDILLYIILYKLSHILL